jgi:hypothetical protein
MFLFSLVFRIFQDPGDSDASDLSSASTAIPIPPHVAEAETPETTPPRPEYFDTPPRPVKTFSGPRHSTGKMDGKRQLELSPRSSSRPSSVSPQEDSRMKQRREKELAGISSVKMAKENILNWKKEVRSRRDKRVLLYDDEEISVGFASPPENPGPSGSRFKPPHDEKEDIGDVSSIVGMLKTLFCYFRTCAS